MAETDLAASRTLATRVAEHFVGKGHKLEALEILTAWASVTNDAEGHKLLAEALRQGGADHPLAKAAFARMEGIAGDDANLAAARAKWPHDKLEALDKEQRKPAQGWQAEVGYNNNVKYKNQVFHIQTEDSGVKRPHIITHLFADGGRILKSFKRSYADLVGSSNLSDQVRAWMKGQHKEMYVLLRSGTMDGVIEGREKGGMEERHGEPDPDSMLKAAKEALATGVASAARTTASQTGIPAVRTPSQADLRPMRAKLHVIRALGDGPILHEVRDEELTIGNDGQVKIIGDKFTSGLHAKLSFKDGALTIEDTGSVNGTFLRIRQPVELDYGDAFVAGDQLLFVDQNPTPNDGPDAFPTYFYSSPKWPTTFRVFQMWEGGMHGLTVVARQSSLQIGRSEGDIIFGNDFWLSDAHCVIEDQGGFIMLTDLGSRGGTFTRIKEKTRLTTGDEILIGRTRLRVELLARAS